MAEVLLPARSKEQARLARTIAAKVAQGYRIESQSDLNALLVKDPTRWPGITWPGRQKRELVFINQSGYPRIELQ